MRKERNGKIEKRKLYDNCRKKGRKGVIDGEMGQLTLRAPSLGGFRRLSYLPNIRESLDLDFRSGLTFACEADGLISLCLTIRGTLEKIY